MNYQEMKDSHEIQIKALVESDFTTFKSQFKICTAFDDLLSADDSHHDCWSYTGDYEHSIFGKLPGSDYCLTQLKDHPQRLDSIDWNEKLGFKTNDLIPRWVHRETILTEAQLREFSRLQLLAHYPEEATA